MGAAVAAVSGYVALRLVFGAVQAGKLHWFGVYCAVVGLAVLLAGAVGWLPA